jgi:hypothetical protein
LIRIQGIQGFQHMRGAKAIITFHISLLTFKFFHE